MYVRARARARACVCVRVHLCMRACVHAEKARPPTFILFGLSRGCTKSGSPFSGSFFLSFFFFFFFLLTLCSASSASLVRVLYVCVRARTHVCVRVCARSYLLGARVCVRAFLPFGRHT